MKAIILAAGRGSRMGNLTTNIPKCLLLYNNKPLIEHQITALKEAGIDDIGIVCGYKKELLTSYGLYQFENVNWSTTNMVYSLLQAREWLEHDTCIISYSDIVYSSLAVKSLCETSCDIAITYDPNWLELWSRRFADPLTDAETFKIDANGFLLTIGDRAHTITEIEGQYMGLIKITAQGFNKICEFLNVQDEKYINTVSMTQLFNNLLGIKIDDSFKIATVPIVDKWYEFDSEKDLNMLVE